MVEDEVGAESGELQARVVNPTNTIIVFILILTSVRKCTYDIGFLGSLGGKLNFRR